MSDPITLSMRSSHLFVASALFAALLFALVAWTLGDRFYLRLATEALLFSGLSLSVGILFGYTGLLPLGQALFFGFGAYASALALRHNPSFWAAIFVVFIATLALGIACWLIAGRMRGVYFALVSFGLAEIVSKAVYNIRWLGASDGLRGIPIVDIPLGFLSISTDAPLAFFLFALVFVGFLYSVSAYVLDTPLGRGLMAMKSNERRMRFLGYPVFAARLVAYVLAAEIAALAGALYPMLRGFVSPDLMYFSVSTEAIIGVVLGGATMLAGPLYGAVILTVLRSIIASLTQYHLLVTGLIFMIAVIFLPRGIIGIAQRSGGGGLD